MTKLVLATKLFLMLSTTTVSLIEDRPIIYIPSDLITTVSKRIINK